MTLSTYQRLEMVETSLNKTNKSKMNTEMIMGKLDSLVDMGIAWAPKLLMAILVLIIGLWVIGKLMKVFRKTMNKSGLDKDLVPFLSSIVGTILKVLLFLSVAGMVGIETTSFIALIGAAGLAIGMALQGTLQHFAAGVMVLIFKPYRVGDLVDIQSQVGTVEEIQIFNTIIKTLDNKKVIMPNGIATSGIMTNLSQTEHLRVDLNAAITYEEDFEKVKGIIMEAINETPGVLKNPAPVVEIEKLDENGVKIAVRPFSTTADYWDVYFGVNKNMKARLGAAGIAVPYPRRNIVAKNA